MATALALQDFSLLACQFEIRPAPSDADQDESGENATAEVEPEHTVDIDEGAAASGELELDGVRLRFSVYDTDEDEFTLVVETKLTLGALPYRLRLLTGSRFSRPDPPVAAGAAMQTLLFVSYPYIRETVTSITSRSPYSRFDLPPLIRLPHPQVTGETRELADSGEAPPTIAAES